ncbi:probable receptor-like protein kinase At1g49730 isoform X2 [Phoenix dactylifera]|uniref:Probable receptor-like protein kinase At1g49730 isoform X2 n=1 Tax=Phoenix dactylifera TaxID=42345 RepID=A0A8B8J949_PHODC|nr:probable receptor-like protein kinase At1g49730 isoform X2 [Phoenix dactylifera]
MPIWTPPKFPFLLSPPPSSLSLLLFPLLRSLSAKSNPLLFFSADEVPAPPPQAQGFTPPLASPLSCRLLMGWEGCWLLGDNASFLSGPIPFVKKFSSKEIKKATDGYSMILGNGRHGTIYKARFHDGLVASVRKIQFMQQGKNAFYRKVQLLGRLHHRHLVRLQGFSEGNDRFLVFDHMENGSLKEYLHDPLRTPLNWRTRLQIAVDVAAALEYLHYFCDPPVYNVSINSNNVLLDENFVAKLSDVGFLDSDLNQIDEPNCTFSEEHIDQRSKELLFQFGVLILELITGQSLGGDDELVQWVQESGFVYSMHKMVDADLGDSYDSKELKSLLVLARLCTKTGDGPLISIPQILRYLQGKG